MRAYHFTMEILIIVLLLMNANREGTDVKRTLYSALSFYRENRELITMLAGAMGKSPEQSSPTNENQPPQTEAVDSIENFFKSHAL